MSVKRKFIVSVFFFILAACSQPQAISQAEAERLAAVKMEEYVKGEKLSFSQFGKPEVRYTDKDAAGKDFNAWEVYYVSKDKPIRHVSITVGRYGGVELHQMIDKMKP